MVNKHLALFVLLLMSLFCGCAAGTPKVEQKAALNPVREALSNYNNCLKLQLKPYLKTKAKPKAIADAVATKCEPKLNDYKFAVRDVYVEGLDPHSEGYNKILISKPEIHANRIREKGKQDTMTRVQEARNPSGD